MMEMEYTNTYESVTRNGQGTCEDGAVNAVHAFEVKKPKSRGIDLDEEYKKSKDKSVEELQEEINESYNPNEIALKGALIEELNEQKLEYYSDKEINWVDDDFNTTWENVKRTCKTLMKHHDTFNEKDDNKLICLAHSKDYCEGKPQLIDEFRDKIPVARISIKKMKDPETKEKTEIKKIFMIDEKHNANNDGYLFKTLAFDFYKYQVSYNDDRYFILSQQKLPNEVCKMNGMLIEIDDSSEFSKTMAVKKLSKLFILKDFESNVKILPKEDLVKFTKKREITEDIWNDILGLHKFGTINRFPLITNKVRSAFVLSGTEDGYPLHLMPIGRSGTGKTMGYLETISWKFDEEPEIIEGGDSRLKGLIPSFKEKPANIGYLARANRMGFVDEIGKMVEFESNKHQSSNSNILGELNFLLEHKIRSVSSGNDNECKVQANSKFLFPSNGVKNRKTIYDHVGLIDPTTLGRLLIWVQGKEECDFVQSEKGIVRVAPTPSKGVCNQKNDTVINKNNEKNLFLKNLWGPFEGVGVNNSNTDYYMNRDEFLTLFDSCYNFVCEIEEEQIEKLFNSSLMLAKEPMKTSVWKSRARHHIKLIIDGVCKTRCLFQDYDDSFIATEEDYSTAEAIIVTMISNWDIDLSPKEDFR